MNTNTQTPAAVFASLNLRYLGRQALGKGRPDAYLFDAPDNSTLMMDGPVDFESVTAKLAEHDEICRKYGPVVQLTDEMLCAAIQAEEKFQW